MTQTLGKVTAIYGNMVTAEVFGPVKKNAVAYCCRSRDDLKLKSEIIRIRKQFVDMQVFESTRGLQIGDNVEVTESLLSVILGPGLLGQVYDGLQNPLRELAKSNLFLKSGQYLTAIDSTSVWNFTPLKKVGDRVSGGEPIGWVIEGIFRHYILVPPYLQGLLEIVDIQHQGEYFISEKLATLSDKDGNNHALTMSFSWPVKIPLVGYSERLLPVQQMVTKQRVIDTMFPICKGGTYCIPGPFGAGKTIIQKITSRYADVDVVIIVACGERASEVVETLQEFPVLEDPRTGRTLMERTIIICNTSSMPVAAREASVYTGVTLAEYYRLMGLQVLLLADSTSRWAQALREISGRLEEIPGEEAFPAYLESTIAAFYERAGAVRLKDGQMGSLTIGGTVSPAGGNFEEPVTQATLKVVGAFHGLSRARADARRFPSIDPLTSWSKYPSSKSSEKVATAKKILRDAFEISQMMAVVGEEGISMADFVVYLKGELFDRAYLQQNAFHTVDAACSLERQSYVFDVILMVLEHQFRFISQEQARNYFFQMQKLFLNWNEAVWKSAAFLEIESKIKGLL